MNISKRVLTGIVIGFTALFAVLHGGLPLTAMVLVIIILASKEYTEILKHKGFLPSFKIILCSSLLFTLTAIFNRFDLVPFVFTISSIMAFMWVLFRGKQPYIANVATTILGFVYCGWFPLHLIFLRDLGTAGYALMILFGVVLTDTMCYYVGCQFGKHKLSAVISPNKTIEGSIGGAVFCIASVCFFGYIMQLAWYHSLFLGILIASFAQIGDLCESMIKRDAGVKDSSNILPGHGGFLDRCDSYILTIPVVYYYVCLFIENNFIDLIKGLF
ncbi:phosphatidate cytidylyltransferase [bacterium]|nr:phosphatidate cytidylyltransferase [bacterium]MBR1776843.1 phosphatidate cytidylyltransferase [bacterium]